MEKDNELLEIISEINEVLEKDDYRKSRYISDVSWFKEHAKMIEKNIIRVAIMGITSSGKSTLVNAILGENILPVAIKPSSSIIITCSKGEKRQATVYFRHKECEILSGSELNPDKIRYFADESENPDNKLGVSQIDITVPDFLLGDNIHIIDSPGLDACDLEMHEKLTLEILLPTIDVCIFLTTVKANSDAVNLEKIKIVHEKGKQIIMVQNMMDSVESKIGKNGIVEEDKITILKKHKKRAERLINLGTNNEGEFEVIQISALNGLKGRINNDENLYHESNLESFVKGVEKCIDKVMPDIDIQRELSIKKRIDQIITTDRGILNGSEVEHIKSLKKVTATHIDDLVLDFTNARDKIAGKIKLIDKVVENTIKSINSGNETDPDGYLSIIELINSQNEKLENRILGIVKRCEENKAEIYRRLNLDMRFNYSIPSMVTETIDVKHKFEERKRRVEKKGVFNLGKRVLSQMFDKSWGYDEEEYDKEIVDKDATIAMVEEVCSENRKKYLDILCEWSNQYAKSLNLFYSEVRKRTEEYETKKEQKIQINDITDVIRSLKYMSNKLSRRRLKRKDAKRYEELKKLGLEDFDFDENNSVSSEISVDKDAGTKYISMNLNDGETSQEDYSNYEISNVHYNVYKLSNELLDKNYLLVGDYINKKAICKLGGECKIIFWIYDIDFCVSFVSRICGIYLKEEECIELKRTGIYINDKIVIIYELAENKLTAYAAFEDLKKNNTNLFVIFNGIQIGNSKKQILESKMLKEFIMNNNVYINLVVDSSREFINADNIKELLMEVFNLKTQLKQKFINSRPGYMLINSRNPIYNMALIESQERETLILSEYLNLKEKLFRNTFARSIQERKVIEQILDYFLDKFI